MAPSSPTSPPSCPPFCYDVICLSGPGFGFLRYPHILLSTTLGQCARASLNESDGHRWRIDDSFLKAWLCPKAKVWVGTVEEVEPESFPCVLPSSYSICSMWTGPSPSATAWPAGHSCLRESFCFSKMVLFNPASSPQRLLT